MDPPAFKSWHSDEEVILASSHPKRRARRKKFNETRHPVYRGVRQRNSDRWVCEVREPTHQKRVWLETYPMAEMAARAHDVAAIALRGPTACLNFADSLGRLPLPASNDPKDIRKAAMEAAKAFQPSVAGAEGSSANVASDGVSGMDDEGYEEEGDLMSPPHASFEGRFGWDDDGEGDAAAEVELWSYSF